MINSSKKIMIFDSNLKNEDYFLLDKIIVLLSKLKEADYIVEIKEYGLYDHHQSKEDVIDLGDRPENVFNFIRGSDFEVFIENNNFKIDEYSGGIERHLILKRRDDEFGMKQDEHNMIRKLSPVDMHFIGSKIVTTQKEFEFDGKIGKEFLNICKKSLKCRGW